MEPSERHPWWQVGKCPTVKTVARRGFPAEGWQVPKPKQKTRFKTAGAVRNLSIRTSAGAGVHPVDRLKLLRTQIADLEVEARAIREMIISGEIEPEGDKFRARIERRVSYDTKAMLAHFGEAMIPFERESPYLFLDFIRIEE
jgi:hypothetical protein